MNDLQTTDLPVGWHPIETAPKVNLLQKLLLGSFPKGIKAMDNPERLDRDQWTSLSGNFYAPTHWHKLAEEPL